MKELINLISEFFSTIWELLTSFVEGLLTFFRMVVEVPVFLSSAIGVLPQLLVTFATAIIAISVVKTIVGR